jgi:CHASE2 domain-containing sensor protein
MLAGKFGRPGIDGWVSAALWGLVTIFVAGFFGSLIGMLPERLSDGFQLADLIAVAAGGLILPFAANDWPWLLLVIPLAIGSAHFRSRGSVRKH